MTDRDRLITRWAALGITLAVVWAATASRAEATPTPANDDFVNAIELTPPSGALVGSNVGATREAEENSSEAYGGTNTIWYRFTPPSSGEYTFTDCVGNYNFDSVIGVYTGAAVNALSTVAENDDGFCPGRFYSAGLTVTMTGGTTYYIAISGYDGDEGVATLNYAPGDVNDLLAGASSSETRDTVGSAALQRGRSVIASTPKLSERLFAPTDGGQADVNLSDGGGVASFDMGVAHLDAFGARAMGIWARGSFTYGTEDRNAFDIESRTGSVQLGVDYKVSNRFLVGVMAQGDLFDQSGGGGGVEGWGYMAGPYAVARFFDETYLETMVNIGLGHNTATTGGVDADYDSVRLYLHGRLSGRYEYGAWLLTPAASAAYYQERSETFVDGAGATVAAATEALWQFRAGPEIGYDLLSEEDRVLRPFVGAQAVVSDARGDSAAASSGDGVSASANGGVEFQAVGITTRAEVRVDGLADDSFSAITGSASARIPF